MTDQIHNDPEDNQAPTTRPMVGNLTDFVEGADKDNPLDIEIAVDDRGRIVVFHDKIFTKEISWFEFHTKTSALNFIIDDGEVRNIGLPLAPEVSRHMQNSHQILTILMDDKTGETIDGQYIPLIIHAE